MLLASRAHLRKTAVALGSRHRFAYYVRGSEPPARPDFTHSILNRNLYHRVGKPVPTLATVLI